MHGRYYRSWSLGFGFWNITFFLESTPSTGQPVLRCTIWKRSNVRTKKQSDTSEDLGWTNVDYLTWIEELSCLGPLLSIIEDIEAAMKMVMKGRRPTMRHVSQTHRVALWSFDRTNSDPQIQIKYVDTKNQLADILTKGSFTLEELNHLLRLFNIMNNSMFSCSLFSPINDPQAMSKRLIQEEKQEKMSGWLQNRNLREF